MSDSQNQLSSSMHGRINGFTTKSSPPLLSDDYKNGNQKSAFTLVDPMSNSRHELLSHNNDFNANHTDPTFRHSNTILTSNHRISDPSSTTWEDNGNKGMQILIYF